MSKTLTDVSNAVERLQAKINSGDRDKIRTATSIMSMFILLERAKDKQELQDTAEFMLQFIFEDPKDRLRLAGLIVARAARNGELELPPVGVVAPCYEMTTEETDNAPSVSIGLTVRVNTEIKPTLH